MIATTPESDRADEEGALNLIAFSPSSGVGFFLSSGKTHRFDLISEESEELTGDGPRVLAHEFGLVRCWIAFQKHGDLIAYTTREYLRAKKAEYFTAVFTRRLERSLLRDLAEFLDDSDLRAILITDEVKRRIEAASFPGLVAEVLLEAERSNLTNLRVSLEGEFGELVHSEPVQFCFDREKQLERPSKPAPWYPAPSFPGPLTRALAETVWSVLARAAAGDVLAASKEPLRFMDLPVERDPAVMIRLRDSVKHVVAKAARHYPFPLSEDDLVQDVALRLFRSALHGPFPFNLESAEGFRRYVAVVCRNALLDSFSRASKGPRMESFNPKVHDVVDPKSDLQEETVKRENSQLLRRALEELTVQQRQVVELSYFRGLSLSEIEDRLKMSPMRAYLLRRKALDRLREIVVQRGGDIVGLRLPKAKL